MKDFLITLLLLIVILLLIPFIFKLGFILQIFDEYLKYFDKIINL